MKIIHFDVDQNFAEVLAGEKVVSSIQDKSSKSYSDAEIITITQLSHVTAETLDQFPSLRCIVTRTVGTDHIDLEECKKRNIQMYHIVDYGASAIAEHTMALLLAGVRHIHTSQKELQTGKFSSTHFPGISLKGKKIGIIGTGRIGLEVVKLAQAFGLEVIAHDLHVHRELAHDFQFHFVDLDTLLKESDIISLHAPATDETHHMINASTIHKMKDGVILINTARGSLIDEQALEENIKKFYFVGLDVLEDEEHFRKGNPLFKYENVIITPHIAFLTDETIKKIGIETEKCIENFLSGREEGRVG